jgi:mycothiol synthase
MLDWAEAHHAELAKTQAERIANLSPKKIVPHNALTVEATKDNPRIESLLKARGYMPSNDWMIKRFKSLFGMPEPVNLPDGFVIKSIDTDHDLQKHMASVFVVFGMQDSIQAYRSIQRAPSYVSNLDLIILSPDGIVASFCTVWVDHANSIAEFEPVGTHPDYRQRGLGKALLAEAHNRLRAVNIKTVGVESWSEAMPANKLYDATGLLPHYKIFVWTKRTV